MSPRSQEHESRPRSMTAIAQAAALNARWTRWLLRLAVVGLVVLGGATRGADAPPSRLEATGLVIPYRKVELAANSDGVITQILVKEGDAVKAGQVLAQLDATREVIEADYAKTIMERRAADYASAQNLFQQKIFSKNQCDDRRIEAELAESQYRLAEQKLDAKQIKTPFAGLVLRLYKEQGESIRSLDPFAELVSLERVYVTLYFDAANLLRIKPGQHAEVNFGAFGPQKVSGVVETVDPVVDPSSGLFRVKVVVDNPAGTIRTGIKATVVLTEESPHAAANSIIR